MEHSYFKEEAQPLIIDDTAKGHLKEMAGWTKFLAIAGFIFTGLFAIMGIAFATVLSSLYNTNNALGGITGFVIGVIYVLIAGLYVYPIYALYKFAVLSKQAVIADDKLAFNTSLRYLKNMFKYIGVLTIISLCVWVLAIVFGIIGASLAGMHH